MKIRIVLLFAISVNLFSQELPGTMWGPEKGGFGYYIKFQNEREFEYLYNGEGGGQGAKGTYIRNGNDITLNVATVNDWGELPAYIKQKTIKCSIQETDSLFSRYKLIGSGGLELWSAAHKKEKGERCIVDGKVVYAYPVEGKVNENVRVREGPGLGFKYYSFYLDEELALYSSLPKGYGVGVLGYSENKTKIDDTEERWYYCVFRQNMWEEQFGWIWGGLIDF